LQLKLALNAVLGDQFMVIIVVNLQLHS